VAVNEPIDPLVRLAISQWPDDAPRGAVSTFCAEHGISRKSFYELRNRARTDGPAAVLEPRTRRPKSSPSKWSDEVKEQVVAVRAALEASGLDHGPISVHEKMHAMGLAQVPSTASLARIFPEAGVDLTAKTDSRRLLSPKTSVTREEVLKAIDKPTPSA
jgi:putative transposase